MRHRFQGAKDDTREARKILRTPPERRSAVQAVATNPATNRCRAVSARRFVAHSCLVSAPDAPPGGNRRGAGLGRNIKCTIP